MRGYNAMPEYEKSEALMLKGCRGEECGEIAD
jgi:hypothetical protein